MSWYFFGGFSAYATVPSGRIVNHSGCSVTHGWSGAHCSARSRATSRPSSCARATNASKSANVPSCGWIASCPPSAEPIAHVDPTSSGTETTLLLGPLRFTVPIGWTGGRYTTSKPIRGDPVELLGGGGERAVQRLAGLVHAAGRAREQLVPRPVQRARPVDPQPVLPPAGDQVADRVGEHVLLHGLGQRLGDPRGQRQRGVAQRGGRGDEHPLVPVGREPCLAARSSSRAPDSRSFASSSGPWAAPTLTSTACRQVAHGSLHASTR